MNIILFILLTLFQEIPTNPDVILLEESTNHINIGKQTFVLEDVDGCFNIKEITGAACQRNFIPSNQQILTFPPNDSYYWVKFSIQSNSDRSFLIFIDEAKFKSIDLYYKVENSDHWKVIKDGYSVPANQKTIAHNFPVFPIELSKGMRGEFYLRFQPQLLSLPISIESQTQFFQVKNSRYNLIFGLIVGIILFIGINNLALYFSSGGKLRLLYFFTALSFVLFAILFDGYIFLISPFIYQNLLRFIFPVSFVGQLLVTLYGITFLQVRKYSTWLFIVASSFLAVLAILTVISLFTSVFYMMICVNLTGILTLLVCLLMGFLTLKNNNSVYRSTNLIYCISYILFFFCFILEMARIYFASDYYFFIRFIDIAFLCEAAGLAIALSVQAGIDKMILENAKNAAQHENLQLISKQNQILEIRVNHRTAELAEKTKIAEQLSNEHKLQSEQLREVNLVKDRLFSIISHDLRSPLSQLQSILNLADKNQLSDDEIKNLLMQVRMNVGVNIQLTDNLLFWARSQMAGAKVYFQNFTLFDVVETKFQFFKYGTDKKKILTSNRTHHDLSIYSDENIIALVIHNLLANAIKFCDPGDTIIVGSELKENEVVIYVSDTGVGMTADDIQNILGNNIFTKHGTANEKGTGLGLKICKDLIQQIKGKLWIESQPGIGTTFYFSIPTNPHMKIVDDHDTPPFQVSA